MEAVGRSMDWIHDGFVNERRTKNENRMTTYLLKRRGVDGYESNCPKRARSRSRSKPVCGTAHGPPANVNALDLSPSLIAKKCNVIQRPLQHPDPEHASFWARLEGSCVMRTFAFDQRRTAFDRHGDGSIRSDRLRVERFICFGGCFEFPRSLYQTKPSL